jgi:hypothetical protein
MSQRIIVHYFLIQKRLLYYVRVTKLFWIFPVTDIKYTKDGGIFMKQKKIKKLLVLIGTACLSLNMFISPAATITTHAAESETLMPYADITEWRFKIENGKMYKRLYNCSTREWIGDWIYVGEYPG